MKNNKRLKFQIWVFNYPNEFIQIILFHDRFLLRFEKEKNMIFFNNLNFKKGKNRIKIKIKIFLTKINVFTYKIY